MKTDWLTFLRGGIGIVLGLMLVAYWQDFGLLHHPTGGLLDADLLQLLGDGPMPPLGQLVAALHRYTGVAAEALLTCAKVIYLGCCALLAAQWKSRWVAAALMLQHHAIYIAVPAFSYGVDFLAMTALACCCTAPSDGTHPGNRAVRHFLRIALCIVYFMGGYDKLGSSWFAGEAVWKALHLPGYAGVAHPLVAVLPAWPPLWAAVGTAVVLIELSYPVGVWFRRSRRAVLAAIIGLHLGIALFLGLYYFSALMVVLHVAAFIAPYTNGLQPVAHPIHSPPGGKYARTLAPDGETGPPTGLPVP